jgi:hypothetical protein
MKIKCPKCNKETRIESIYRDGPKNLSEWSCVCDECELTIKVSWRDNES